MEIVGRLTKDAIVREVSEGKTVVNFSIAINHGYSKKGEWVDKTTFVECSFWRNTGIAKLLTKGRQVELFGEMTADAYLNSSKEPVGVLRFFVMNIRIGSKPQSGKLDASEVPVPEAEAITPHDDLPF